MTFNIHHGKGTDGKVNLKRIADVIQESNADIIGLNEVDRQFSTRSNYVDQVAWLSDYMQMHHTFGPAVSLQSKREPSPKRGEGSFQVREYGNALLSKYPIQHHENHPFHSNARMIEGRSLLEASIFIDSQMLRVFTTHLSLNPFLHRKQTNVVLNKIKGSQESVIVFGDWNMRPKARGWKKMTEHFTDVWGTRQKQKGYTFPSTRPRARLDYIFVSKDFSILSAKVVTEMPNVSDHLPLEATLRL
jgi:endonuclease/exonuclease/phosphatase family metal-dependent hydrolase